MSEAQSLGAASPMSPPLYSYAHELCASLYRRRVALSFYVEVDSFYSLSKMLFISISMEEYEYDLY